MPNMTDIDVASIERILLFEQRVKNFQTARNTLFAKFRREVETVGRTWKDADYKKIVELTGAVEQQLKAAGRVVDEHLVPFLALIHKVIDEKKRH